MSEFYFNILLATMFVVAIIVFISLYFVKAGYGVFASSKWGFAFNNKIAWFIMEVPVFIMMFVMLFSSDKEINLTRIIIFSIFQIHYFQRSIIFPFLLRGSSKMPLAVVAMGVVFNLLNAFIQGTWLFDISYSHPFYYDLNWLYSPQFIIGTLIFFFGFFVNLNSDSIIRNLRKNRKEKKHYLPKGGFYNKVTSANYFGEILEWAGFAVLTFSIPALLFFVWTFANLVPRAAAIYKNYQIEYSEEMKERKLKRVFPYIY